MQNVIPLMGLCTLVCVVAAPPESHKYTSAKRAALQTGIAEIRVVHAHLLVHLDFRYILVYLKTCIGTEASPCPYDDTFGLFDKVHDSRNFSEIL